ncbi:uncharacterized protein [Symphalangus syndactylus]|uniref:uncharacterized protein n=1 Tax=Symphalangus syndactylus TaxID=9590 RepID=UPI003005D388
MSRVLLRRQCHFREVLRQRGPVGASGWEGACASPQPTSLTPYPRVTPSRVPVLVTPPGPPTSPPASGLDRGLSPPACLPATFSFQGHLPGALWVFSSMPGPQGHAFRVPYQPGQGWHLWTKLPEASPEADATMLPQCENGLTQVVRQVHVGVSGGWEEQHHRMARRAGASWEVPSRLTMEPVMETTGERKGQSEPAEGTASS